VFARAKHSNLLGQSVNNCEEKWNDTFLRNSCFKIFSFWVRVNQRTNFPLSTMYFPLLPAAIRPNDYVSSVGVTLACYQQAGSGGKYIGVSGKWVRWFTLTLSFSVFVGFKRQLRRQGTQHNNIQHNDTQHNNLKNATLTQHNDTRNCAGCRLCLVSQISLWAECYYVKCRYAECRGADFEPNWETFRNCCVVQHHFNIYTTCIGGAKSFRQLAVLPKIIFYSWKELVG
jgi:hypothetical protein